MSGLDGCGRGGGGASGDVSIPQVTLVDCVYMHLCFTSAYDDEFTGLGDYGSCIMAAGSRKTTTFFG